MMFLRDEMYHGDLANWRYGFDPDDKYVDWYLNVGLDFDEMHTLLFGA